MYDIAYVIGRFQPFHAGHNNLITEAFRYAKKVVILLGSANISLSIRNPYPPHIGAEIINSEFPEVEVIPTCDYPYDDSKWVNQIKDLMDSSGKTYCLVGADLDASTYYLKIFGPSVNVIDISNTNCSAIHATGLREALFTNKSRSPVPNNWFAGSRSASIIMDNIGYIQALMKEYEYVSEYKSKWKGSPFPPTFNTTDSVVVHRGNVLTITRGGHPGKGLMALPGGFLNLEETTLQGALRELREETSICVINPETGNKIPYHEGWLVGNKVFDHPNRSSRGRVITHAYVWKIPDRYECPVKAADDAATVAWTPLSIFVDPMNSTKFVEDHFFIAEELTAMCK